MQIQFKAVVNQVYVSPEKGLQYLTFCDLGNGGMFKMSMGQDHAAVVEGQIVKFAGDVKTSIYKDGGVGLAFRSGKFEKSTE